MKKIIILYLEDDLGILKPNTEILKNLGFEVIDCSYQDKVLNAMEGEFIPDIALLDIKMEFGRASASRQDGIDIALAMLKHRRIPIVFFSALADNQHYKRRIKNEIDTTTLLLDKSIDFKNIPTIIEQQFTNFNKIINNFDENSTVMPAINGKIRVNYDVPITKYNAKHEHKDKDESSVMRMLLNICDIDYIEADGVNVNIYLNGKKIWLLTNKKKVDDAILVALGSYDIFKARFFHGHSYTFNLDKIVGLSSERIYFGEGIDIKYHIEAKNEAKQLAKLFTGVGLKDVAQKAESIRPEPENK